MKQEAPLVVIGLVGAKGAGKNTFAKIIRDRYPFVREGALAYKLKRVCSEVFGIPHSMFDTPEAKEAYIGSLFQGSLRATGPTMYAPVCEGPIRPTEHQIATIIDAFGFSPNTGNVMKHVGNATLYTPRQIAQYIGTEVLRSLSEDVHCLGLMKDQPKDGVLIVTDIRFPNELAFFMNRYGSNFYPVYISNGAAEAKAMSDAHESEKHVLDLAKSCRPVDNNGSIDDLTTKAQNFADSVFASYPGLVEVARKESA